MAPDEGEPDRDSSERSDPEDVEEWPPREGSDGPPQAPSPDHEQARQGAREPPSDPSPSTGPHRRPSMSDADARNWAAGAHLSSLVLLLGIPSVIGPLIVWLVKRDEHPFVADQAREALNFQISVLIYAIAGVIAAAIFAIATMGFGVIVILPVALLFALAAFLLPIIAAVKASDGQRYRYPLALRFISGAESGSTAERPR